MAIVKMNKFTLLTFDSHKEELLRKLQGFSNVEFINLQNEEYLEANEELKTLSKDEVDSDNAKFEENLSKAKSALEFLINYMPKKSGLKALEDDKEYLTIDELDKRVEAINWIEIYNKVKAKEEELHNLENKITKLEGEIEILTPWQALDTSFKALEELSMTSCFLGSIAKQYEEELIQNLTYGYVEIISRNNNDVNVLILVNKEKYEETLNMIRSYGFSSFKSEHTDTPQMVITNYMHEIEELKSKIFFIKEEVASFEEDTKKMKLVYEYFYNKVERNKASNNFLKTKNIVTIQGWCAVDKNEELKTICKDILRDEYYINFEDVKEEEIDNVPIKLNNGILAKTFESVTAMYSFPRYDEVDPTPFLVPFYLLFFGMMVADAGYGLVMFIATFAVLKFLNLDKGKKDFARFGMFLSIPTIFFGVIYGSYFGDILPIPGLLVPTKDVITILAASIVFGVIQIFFGLGIKYYSLCRMGKTKDAFIDVGSWIITLISIGVFAGSGMLGWPAFIRTISIVGMIFGALLIIYSGGRNEQSKGAQIGQGLYNLYNINRLYW
jgi:V/A-type H+-transporting ATPase subunit I